MYVCSLFNAGCVWLCLPPINAVFPPKVISSHPFDPVTFLCVSLFWFSAQGAFFLPWLLSPFQKKTRMITL